MQAPSPARALRVAGSTKRICNEPGLPVTVSVAMRGTPSPRAVPAAVTPKPAMVRVSPTATRRAGARLAGVTASSSGAASLSSATSAVARFAA